MIKLIALDLDNTLLEKDNSIHPRTLALLQACIRSKVTVVIATGRLYLSARKYARQIGPECKVLCYNGSMVTEADGTVLFSRALPVHTMRQIISFCRQRGLYCQFYQDHKILVEKVTEGTTIDPDLANTQAIEAVNFDDYNLLPSPKAMIVAPPESVPHIQTCLAGYLKDSVYLAQSQPYLIEIMPAGINKANSLKLLCDRLSIDSSEVMACGDNTNDAEMIRWAGVGVAVSNSISALKSDAFYVASQERSLGVAEAIEKFIPL